jgi:hypothetical protein
VLCWSHLGEGLGSQCWSHLRKGSWGDSVVVILWRVLDHRVVLASS